jgi:hypothetical protein
MLDLALLIERPMSIADYSHRGLRYRTLEFRTCGSDGAVRLGSNSEILAASTCFPLCPNNGHRATRRHVRVVPKTVGNGGLWRQAVITAYDALMNGNSNQSRLHIAPGTSSARRPDLKPYQPQKWKLKIPRDWQASHV